MLRYFRFVDLDHAVISICCADLMVHLHRKILNSDISFFNRISPNSLFSTTRGCTHALPVDAACVCGVGGGGGTVLASVIVVHRRYLLC